LRALTFDPHRERWRLRSRPVPTARGHDVLVRVQACGLNPVDAKIAMWKSAVEDMDENWVAGLDVAGEIAAVGEDVTGWKEGDRVLTHGNMFRPHGGLAEFTLQDARTLVAHPAGIDATTAAATPCAGWTAWRALHDRLRVTAADSLLVAGGSGGVGGFALQIARDAGLRSVIATTSARNVEYAASLGATEVVDYTRSDVVSRVHEITGGAGVTRGLDTVGGDNARLVADCLAFEGEMVELVDVVDARSFANAFDLGLSFHQLSLGSGHRNGEVGRQTLTRTGVAFNRALEEGRLAVPRLEVVGLEETGGALTSMLSQRTVGKVVVQMRTN
jgi:NADPH:quinone reductase-like Zn-dependent oxidoreductase